MQVKLEREAAQIRSPPMLGGMLLPSPPPEPEGQQQQKAAPRARPHRLDSQQRMEQARRLGAEREKARQGEDAERLREQAAAAAARRGEEQQQAALAQQLQVPAGPPLEASACDIALNNVSHPPASASRRRRTPRCRRSGARLRLCRRRRRRTCTRPRSSGARTWNAGLLITSWPLQRTAGASLRG